MTTLLSSGGDVHARMERQFDMENMGRDAVPLAVIIFHYGEGRGKLSSIVDSSSSLPSSPSFLDECQAWPISVETKDNYGSMPRLLRSTTQGLLG